MYFVWFLFASGNSLLSESFVCEAVSSVGWTVYYILGPDKRQIPRNNTQFDWFIGWDRH